MRSDHKATQSLAIYPIREGGEGGLSRRLPKAKYPLNRFRGDRKSTRLNSSH